MPTVPRWRGMAVMIYTHDHTQQAHVHVWVAGNVGIIDLPTPIKPQAIRKVKGMRTTDIVKAFGLVAADAEYLLGEWRGIHGDEGTL